MHQNAISSEKFIFSRGVGLVTPHFPPIVPTKPSGSALRQSVPRIPARFTPLDTRDAIRYTVALCSGKETAPVSTALS